MYNMMRDLAGEVTGMDLGGHGMECQEFGPHPVAVGTPMEGFKQWSFRRITLGSLSRMDESETGGREAS